MLEVISLDEARLLVSGRFGKTGETVEAVEAVALGELPGRALAHDLVAEEGVPPFDRSTVDGFAVIASDTFGCSDALPALLTLAGEIDMGAEPPCACTPGTCVRIPTGGQLPNGADTVVMLEYCEEYGDGTIGIARPAAPGDNIVFANDDVRPGQVLIPRGTLLLPHHVGTIASLGLTTCEVKKRPRVAIISTGDEIIPVDQTPVASQMRDVNTPVLSAAVRACGAEATEYPIVSDDYAALLSSVSSALTSSDLVLVSGGSSAGQKDNTARVLSEIGTMLFHGIAVKPGKPTMCADAHGIPVFGLPGHPVAAYFMFLELVKPLLAPPSPRSCATATIAAGIPSNHGRSELVPVRLQPAEGSGPDDASLQAVPVRGKSGLISQLCMADGYLEIDRNREGIAAGTCVQVKLFR